MNSDNRGQMSAQRPRGTLILQVAIFFAIPFVVSPNTTSAPLAGYRERVANAAQSLEHAQLSYEEDDLSLRQETLAAAIARVRVDLPVKEQVVTQWETIEVDNAWLHESLNNYEKADWTEQISSETLARIAERLRAIEARLIEIETGKLTGTASKDEEKARLTEILRRAEFNQKEEQESALQRFIKRIVQWLDELFRRLFPNAKPIQPGTARSLSNIAQVVVIACAVAVIAFVAWKLLPRFLRSRSKKKTKKREARIVLGERLEPDQTAADLFAEAEALARRGDLRAAIRKSYIALLCELGDRKLISLAQHKTNRDYLNAVRDKTRLHKSMRPLTVAFENHWYGFVPVEAHDWNNFRDGYRTTLGSE